MKKQGSNKFPETPKALHDYAVICYGNAKHCRNAIVMSFWMRLCVDLMALCQALETFRDMEFCDMEKSMAEAQNKSTTAKIWSARIDLAEVRRSLTAERKRRELVDRVIESIRRHRETVHGRILDEIDALDAFEKGEK